MLEKVLIATLAGLFGVLPAIIQWISGRNKIKSYEHKIQKLSNELEFLDKVRKFDEENGELTSQAHLEAERIFQQYRELQTNDTEEKIQDTRISFVRRAFLLFKPLSFKASIVHTIFYVLFFFISSMIISEYGTQEIDPVTGRNSFNMFMIGISVMFGPVFFLLQRIALRAREYDLKK